MVNVGSLPAEGSRLFDLDTQAGVTAVLLAVRASAIETSIKNDIRDLVFLYTNGGKDQSVRIALEQKIATAGLVPLPRKETVPSIPEQKRELPTIGTFRTTPAFSIPPVPDVVTSVQPIVAEIPPEPTPTPSVSAPLFSNQPKPLSVAEPTPNIENVSVPPVVMPKADQQQYLERIREIKSLVNQKVGNPVNLVDINNEVGREYMSALLDAMKRINSGQTADAAMQRLEEAFRAVEETLRRVGDTAQVVQTTSVPVVPVAEAPIASPAVQSVPVYVPPPEPVYAPPQPVAQTIPVTPVFEPVVQPPHVESVASAPPVFPQTHIEPVVPTPSYVAPATSPTVHAPIPQTFSSLADMVQQSHAQAGLPTTPVAAAPLQSGDPLLSPQVEEGLTQLLSEWSIFKKSGIFGTGPKGREHPLYKKMADLQIPLLLAGRFEGATQEVRQSLTDYMNGWRYEQGLIYEKGETFEHYLRRVIRHILEQQSR
jgi:hypothetical protein